LQTRQWAAVLLLMVFASVLFSASSAPRVRADSTPVSIATGVSPGYPVSLNDQRKLFYDANTTLWWAFYADGLGMECTTSGDGVNWSSPTVLYPSVSTGSVFSTWFDQASDKMYYVVATSGSTLDYRYGTLSSGGCGSIDWLVSPVTISGSHGGTSLPTIAASDPSSVWISSSESTANSSYVEVFKCVEASCSSSHLVQLNNETYDSEVFLLDGGSNSSVGLIYAADAISGGSPIVLDYSIDSGASWISSAAVTPTGFYGNRMSAVALGSTVFVTAVQNGPNNLYFFTYGLGGTISTETLLSSTATRNACIVTDGHSTLVVAFSGATTISYVSSTDLGKTWGAVSTPYDSEGVLYQSIINLGWGPEGDVGTMWSSGMGPYSVRFATIGPFVSTITNTTTSTSSSVSMPFTNSSTTANSTSVNSTSVNSTSTTRTTSPSSSTTSTTGQSQTNQTTSGSQGSPLTYIVNTAFSLLGLDLASAIVAFGIGFYSFRLNRLVGSVALIMITLGFALLGTGLLIEGLTYVIANATIVNGLLAKKLLSDAGLLFLGLQVAAYASFAMGYGFEVFSRQKPGDIDRPELVLPAGVLVTIFGGLYDEALGAYLFMVALLAFIVFEELLIFSKNRRQSAFLVLLGFGLILGAHLFMLDSVVALAPSTFFAGTVLQFFGFVLLLWFLMRSARFGTK
jgi:hypothetical protein